MRLGRTCGVPNGTRGVLWAWAWCVALAGCGQLDPIKVKSRCEPPGPVREECPQCLVGPFPPECPQCSRSDAFADGTCSSVALETVNATQPGGQGDAQAGSSDSSEPGTPGGGSDGGDSPGHGPADSGGAAMSGGSETPGQGGSGGPDSTQNPPGGSNGMAGSNDASAPAGMPTRCRFDSDCEGTPDTPVCQPTLGVCQECINDPDCVAGQCDQMIFRCYECITDEGCAGRDNAVCDRELRQCVGCRSKDDCEAPTPSCDRDTQQCVECTRSQDCPPERSACETRDNTCYACVEDGDCSGTTRVCAEHACVECTTSGHCAGQPERSLCEPNSNTCVACLSDEDCGNRSAAHCDPDTHSCVGCSDDSHCAARFAGSAPRCVAGTCEPCDENGGICGDKACILSRHECSTVDKNSIEVCGACESSDECSTLACVPVMIGSYNTGNHCLYVPSEFPGAKQCLRPFLQVVRDVPSPDGVSFDEICAPPKDVSCQAILDAKARKSCNNNNAECGIDPATTPLNDFDGYCSTSGCTYHCTSDDDCLDVRICSQGFCK